jgi:hypothetical protein
MLKQIEILNRTGMFASVCGAPRASPWHHLVSPIRFANGGT